MNIRDKIGSIVATLDGVSFNYARKSEHNVDADNIAFPNALFIEPDSFGFTPSIVSGNLKEYTNIFIQFTTRMPNQDDPVKDEIGRDANYRNAMIEEMRDLARQFVQIILSDEDFENIINDMPMIPVIEAYDANVFGVELQIPKLIHTFPLPC